MNLFLSPEEIWSNISLDGDLNCEVLNIEEFGEYEYQQVMFDGQKFEDGACRIFGVFAYNKNATKPMPCVLLIHDLGGRIDYTYIDYFLHMGYAVLMCDYYGERDGERHTIFPPSHEHLNFSKSVDDLSLNFIDSQWINATLIFRYAIKFLKEQPNINADKIGSVSLGKGSICGFQLAFCEEKLAISANFHYGGWEKFDMLDSQMDSNLASYLLAMAPQVYSNLAKVPFFLLGSTNTVSCDSDRCFDTFARGNGLVYSYLYLSPNYISTVDHHATKNLKLLLSKYLDDANIGTPFTPHIEYSTEYGEIVIKCQPDRDFSVKKITCYISQGDSVSYLRCYNASEMALSSEGDYIAYLHCDQTLNSTVFANVEYNCGYTISSNLLKVPAFGTQKLVKRVISCGTKDTFFSLGALYFPKANQFFNNKPSVLLEEGHLGVQGISATRLATFAIGDPRLIKNGKCIALQIYSSLPQQVRLILAKNPDAEHAYSATFSLVGGDLWQQVLLDCEEFTDAQMKCLNSLEHCNLMFFNSEYDFLLSNMAMV